MQSLLPAIAEMDHQLQVLQHAVKLMMEDLAKSASDDVLQRLLPLKSSLAAFHVQIKEFGEAVEDLASAPPFSLMQLNECVVLAAYRNTNTDDV